MKEAKEVEVKFFISSTDATKTFDALKEVFYSMSATIVAAIAWSGLKPPRARWNAWFTATVTDVLPELVTVIALVRHDMRFRRKD